MKNQLNNQKKKSGKFKTVLQWLWRFFSSVRLAVILIIIIIGLSLVGALLIQVPQEIKKDPQAYSQWVSTAAADKVGFWSKLLSALHLFDVFHSPWFIIANSLLMINILICSLNRWSSIKLSIRGGSIRQEESFYISGNSCAELKDIQALTSEVEEKSERVLKARGYRIRTERDKDNIYMAADRNRYYRLGTYFSHFSLILFVLAFVAGNYFGFRELSFSVAEGSIREVGHETGLSMQLVSFVDEYYSNGAPKDYRSEVILYEDSKPVKKAIIQVNHPMIYKGVRFYQSYFGPAVKIAIRDKTGQEIYSDNVAMDNSFVIEDYRRQEGIIDLGFLQDISKVHLISSAVNLQDPIIPPGFVAVDIRNKSNEQITIKLLQLGVPRIIGDLEFTFLEDSKYSGFQVSHDPSSTIIWIAGALFIIGICSVLYFPYRQVWILYQPKRQGSGRLLLRARSPRGFRSNSELDVLVNQLKKELSTNQIKE